MTAIAFSVKINNQLGWVIRMNLKKIVLICLSWFLVCLSLYSYFLYKDRALVKNEKVSSKELAESTEEDTTPVDTEVTSLKNE